MVCGHDEMLKLRYARLNVLSIVEILSFDVSCFDVHYLFRAGVSR